MQVAAVGELAAVEDKKAPVGDVEDNRFCFGVIRVLDELEGHHVVALQPCQVAPMFPSRFAVYEPLLRGWVC
jgi:hypothetical protein